MEIHFIALRHLGFCWGACPTYSYVLKRDGTARYEGYAHVPIKGRYLAVIDSVQFEKLAQLFLRHRFFEMPRGTLAWDASITELWVGVRDTFRVIHNAYGPDAFRELVAAVEDVGAKLEWRKAQ